MFDLYYITTCPNNIILNCDRWPKWGWKKAWLERPRQNTYYSVCVYMAVAHV